MNEQQANVRRVHFRWIYNTHLDVPQLAGDPVEARVGDVEVTIRYPKEGEIGFGRENGKAICIVTVTRQADEQVWVAMGDLASRRLPEGGEIPSEHPATLADDRTVEGKHAIVRSWLPAWLRDYFDEVERVGREASRRALRIARWRLALSPSHWVIQSIQMPTWSYDAEQWHPLPFDIQIAVGVERPSRFPPDTLQDISVLVEKPYAKELLGHELLIEAWNQKGANPRSALIVGIAAAEAGIKEFIAELEPSTAWLLENMPSPSLSDLLRKYLPQLLKDHGIRDPAKRPPSLVMNVLDEGVQLRNKVAHGIERPVSAAQVTNTLLAVRDILWMLDAFRGYEWARQNVRSETLEAWDPKPPA